MFLATGDANHVDVLELALYNAVLAGVSLDGTDYFYVNPLRNTEPLPTELRWSRTRVPFVTSYCCPPNVLRTIAEVHGYAYSKTDEGDLAESLWRQYVVHDARRAAAQADANDRITRGTGRFA